MHLINLNTQPQLNYEPTLRQRILRETEEYLNRHSREAISVQNVDFHETLKAETCCFLAKFPCNREVSWA
jgi:hypothetical protein